MVTSKVLWSGICVLALVLALAGGCGRDKGSGPHDKLPGEFGVELENFMDKSDILDSATIHAAICSGASGGHQVEGMDVAGEWIKVPLHVEVAGTYEATLAYQADGVPVEVAMTVEGCGDPSTVVSFTLEEHAGIG
jgi:hypothetical protein